MRSLITTTILFTFLTGFGQKIEIGQDAKQIKSLIEWSTNESYGTDSYGNSNGNNITSDVKYYNGQISEVIQCYHDQYLIDFRLTANYCCHYIMESGQLAYTSTQYKDLSIEKLNELYQNKYGNYKIGGLFFYEDYLHYAKIYLAKNGLATVEWRKTEINQLPKSIQRNISEKLKTEQDDLLKKQKEEIETKSAEKEIKSKIYDLQKYDSVEYKKICAEQSYRIGARLVEISKSAGSRYVSSSSVFIPSYSLIEKADKKYFTFHNSYSAYYYLKDNSTDISKKTSQYSRMTLESGDDKNCLLLNDCHAIIPTIQYQGREVLTEATIKITVNYVKGITTVKIKDGVVTYKENAPPNEFQSLLTEKLKSERNGSIKINYEVGIVMDNKFVITEIAK